MRERERERESYVPLSLSLCPSRSSSDVPYLARSFTSARVIIYHERAFVNSNEVHNYYIKKKKKEFFDVSGEIKIKQRRKKQIFSPFWQFGWLGERRRQQTNERI